MAPYAFDRTASLAQSRRLHTPCVLIKMGSHDSDIKIRDGDAMTGGPRSRRVEVEPGMIVATIERRLLHRDDLQGVVEGHA